MVSSNSLTSDDLLRCRRVLDEALAADKLDSAQYRTRIRALVVAASRQDLDALTRDLVPAVGEPGFFDEGHRVPSILSSTPAAQQPQEESDMTRAVPMAYPPAEPDPVDSFPSFPHEEYEHDESAGHDDSLRGSEENSLPGEEEDSLPGEEDYSHEAPSYEEETRLEQYEEDSLPEEESLPEGYEEHVPADEDPPGLDAAASPEPPEEPESPGEPQPVEEDRSETRLVPAVRDDSETRMVPVRLPVPPAPVDEPAPGELVPVTHRSAEVSPVEQAASTSTELSPVEQRSTEVSSREPVPGAELSPDEPDDDESVNRVVVVMVPSASSPSEPSEPSVTGSIWDALVPAEPGGSEPAGEPEHPAEPEAEEVAAEPQYVAPEPEPEEEVEATRISAPINFDDSEAPTQVLDAVKDLPIFRDEADEEIAEPPQPVLPYSTSQGLSGTPADPMAQSAPATSASYLDPQMPPPVPDPSPAALAAMPPPASPAPDPLQNPWGPYGQDPLASMPPPPDPLATMPPPDPAVMAPPPVNETGYEGYEVAPYYAPQQSYGQYAAAPMPPPAPYQPPAPLYSSEPVAQQAPRRSAWPWVVVTLMVLALLAWIAYLVFFQQGRRSASEATAETQGPGVTAVVAAPSAPGPSTVAQPRPEGAGAAGTGG